MITILFLLPVTLSLSSPFRVGHSIAGVSQVSSLDDSRQPQYPFNASDARLACGSLGLTMASKAQLQRALAQGFQTCRFGWIDEHFAVVPRVTSETSCGQGKTGLVEWRASVRKHFDVFCFNGSGTQSKDAPSDSPVTSTDHQGHTPSPSRQDTTLTSDPLPSTSPPPPPAPSTLPSIPPAGRPLFPFSLLRFIQGGGDAAHRPALLSSTQGSFKVPTKPLLIGVTCALLLVITAVLGFEKWNRSCFQSWDMTRLGDDVEPEENASVITEPEVSLEEGTDDTDSWDTAL